MINECQSTRIIKIKMCITFRVVFQKIGLGFIFPKLKKEQKVIEKELNDFFC